MDNVVRSDIDGRQHLFIRCLDENGNKCEIDITELIERITQEKLDAHRKQFHSTSLV